MIDFEDSESEKILRQTVRDFAKKEIARIQLRLSLPTLGGRERAGLLARLDDLEHVLLRSEGTARSTVGAQSLESMRNVLRADEAYVALHRDRAFVLTPSTMRVVRLAPGDRFEAICD